MPRQAGGDFDRQEVFRLVRLSPHFAQDDSVVVGGWLEIVAIRYRCGSTSLQLDTSCLFVWQYLGWER